MGLDFEYHHNIARRGPIAHENKKTVSKAMHGSGIVMLTETSVKLYILIIVVQIIIKINNWFDGVVGYHVSLTSLAH